MRALFIPLAMVIASVQAEDNEHHHHDEKYSGSAQIVVTINPEARVSAIIGKPLPPPSRCGSAVAVKVEIVNQGFVTAPLRAAIVGDGGRHAALHMDGEKLNGKSQDSRMLHLTPLGPDSVDVTIAFSIDNNIGDLGGRDRVHLLLKCSTPERAGE